MDKRSKERCNKTRKKVKDSKRKKDRDYQATGIEKNKRMRKETNQDMKRITRTLEGGRRKTRQKQRKMKMRKEKFEERKSIMIREKGKKEKENEQRKRKK